MKTIIVGSVALDTVETPFGVHKDILGGSAVHASLAASFFESVGIVGIVGKDFPREHLDFLTGCGIDVSGIHMADGETFRWSGYYEYDMNQAHTRETHLNVLTSFEGKLPESYRSAEYVFLANIDPDVQLSVLSQVQNAKFVACDTMNFWIESKQDALWKVLRKVDLVLMNDAEIRQLTKMSSIPQAAKSLIKSGVKSVIVKKGEHGALFFSKNDHFSAPSYPQETLKDPTGAGDSFAGGLIGFLSYTRDISPENIRRGIVVGSVMASFNVEDFGCDRIRVLKEDEIYRRFEEFRSFSAFEQLDPIATRR